MLHGVEVCLVWGPRRPLKNGREVAMSVLGCSLCEGDSSAAWAMLAFWLALAAYSLFYHARRALRGMLSQPRPPACAAAPVAPPDGTPARENLFPAP
jgi:hypothetical protein